MEYFGPEQVKDQQYIVRKELNNHSDHSVLNMTYIT